MQSNQQQKIPKTPQTNKKPKQTKTPLKLLEENGKLKESIIGFSITLSIILYSLLIYITLVFYWSPE